MKAFYIVGDKIFNLPKRLCIKRDTCVFHMNTMEFTKVFQDNMLSAFKFIYKLGLKVKKVKVDNA